MKASTLIAELEQLVFKHGNPSVYLIDNDTGWLLEIRHIGFYPGDEWQVGRKIIVAGNDYSDSEPAMWRTGLPDGTLRTIEEESV